MNEEAADTIIADNRQKGCEKRGLKKCEAKRKKDSEFREEGEKL